MSGGNDMPWSANPRNGIKAFFTEDIFSRWIEQDSHESRLEERLTKLGISPPARLTGPIFLSTPKPAEEIAGSSRVPRKVGSHRIKGQGSATATATESSSKSHKTEKSSKLEVKAKLPVKSHFSGVQTDKTIHKAGLDIADKGATLRYDNATSRDAVNYLQHSNANVVDTLREIKHENDLIGQKKEESIKKKEESIEKTVENKKKREESIKKKVESIKKTEETIKKREESIKKQEESNKEKEESNKEKEESIKKKEESNKEKVESIKKTEETIKKKEESNKEKEENSTEVIGVEIGNSNENTTELIGVEIGNSNENTTELIGVEIGNSNEEATAIEAECVRPFSFYKEGTEEELKRVEKENEEEVAVTNTNDAENVTSGRQNNLRPSKHDTGDKINSREGFYKPREAARHAGATQDGGEPAVTEMSEEARKEYEEKKEEEARKVQRELMMQDKVFFNIKDRQAEKHFPEVFKKKPRNRRSKLTCQEQKLYIDLVRCYGNLSANSSDIVDKNFKKYLAMKVMVNKEQELFQNYLRSISYICKKDYDYIHPEVEQYAATRYLVKKRECFKYPRFYSNVDKIVLTDTIPDTPPTLQYVRPLLELGSVSKLVLPNIIPGMPQPCVTTNFKKINEISPVLKGVYKGTYVWNKVMCSQDANAEQLAVPNKCDVVMSSSAVRRLIDNQGKIFKYWDMPFTVREYHINEGEKTMIHKIVYIDKPLIRPSQNIPKDRIQLYQKHAIRASAIRTNVRGHVFCGIKPVHELVKLPTIEEVEQEMKQYEEKLKETHNPSAVHDDKNEDGDAANMDLRKRNGKHAQAGMFDVEKDIDDLETFGMDLFLGSKGKGDGNKSSPDEKSLFNTKVAEQSGKTVKKGRNTEDDDLEFLKKELKGIKTQAIKESFKHPEMYKDTYSKENKNEIPCSENAKSHETDEESSDSKNHKEGFDEAIVKSDENVENDQEHESHIDSNTTDSLSSAPRNTRKSKKDILSVKSMSSFSEKMKQMSTIKSKLMQRTQGQDFVPHAQSADTLCRTAVRTNSSEFSNNLLSHPDALDIGKETETEQKLGDSVTDSDTEGEGLVIDVPTESPGNLSGKKDEPESPEMPTLERISNNVKCEMTVKDENQSVSLESELGSPNLSIALEDMEEVGVKSKGTKRRSTSDISENVAVPKRVLRSSSCRETLETTTNIQTRNKTSDNRPLEPKGNSFSNDIDKVAVPSLSSGRGKKRDYESVSTRSRSASFESGVLEQETSSLNRGKRITRHSLSSSNVAATKDGEDIDTVPAKRGRGRCKKNATQCNKTVSKDGKLLSEELDEASEKLTPTLTDDDVNMVNDEGKDDGSTSVELRNSDAPDQDSENKDADSENGEEILRTRNKTSVKRIESDTESKQNSRDGFEETHSGKGHSATKKAESNKDWSDVEARKIKEMAEAMKKKIAESKSKIMKEKRRISIESTKSDNEKLDTEGSDLFKVSDNTDKATNATVTIVKSDQSKGVKAKEGINTSAATGLDKGLENILKLQDQIHRPDATKGSLAEVFTQNHGMTHCGFPMEDNVTYHQWNLGGTNVLIRCKYHGFISGQGLVHISPKIEYQPNFGFEQDTVNEICKNWISIYVRPNSSLLKPRINPFNSEIMMFENVAYKDIVPPDSLFSPAQAFTDLNVILDKMKSLPVGQYLLKNNPRKDQFTIMKASEYEERKSFDLHLNNSSVIKCVKPPSMQWTPLDASLMLPHQRKMNFIPCTFQPKDAKIGEKKQQPQKNKKKKKKRRNTDSQT